MVVLVGEHAVGVGFGPQQCDRVGEAFVAAVDETEVLEPAQNVVEPPRRIRQHCQPEVGRFARRLALVQAAFEQVLLGRVLRRARGIRPAGRHLPLAKTFEHADRGVERRHRRAVLGVAVPAAVGQPPFEDRRHDRIDGLAEVRTHTEGDAVDARLGLTLEVQLAVVVPACIVADERYRTLRLRAGGFQSVLPQ